MKLGHFKNGAKGLFVGACLLALPTFALAANNLIEVVPNIAGQKHIGNDNYDNQFDLSYGIRFGSRVGQDWLVEFGYERGSGWSYVDGSDTDLNRFFIDVVKEFDTQTDWTPYVLIGAGHENITNKDFSMDNANIIQYGAGVRWEMSQYAHLKTDLRHIISFDGRNDLALTLGVAIPFGTYSGEYQRKRAEQLARDREAAAQRRAAAEQRAASESAAQDNPHAHHMQQDNASSDNVIVEDDRVVVTGRTQDGRDVVVQDDKITATRPTQSGRSEVVGEGEIVVVEETSGKTPAPSSYTFQVQFPYNSAQVLPEYQSEIQDFADFLKQNTQLNTKVKGHTDSIGGQPFNQRLSERRANSVKQELINYGVEANRIQAEGFGKKFPIADNATEEGRAQNRRVEAELIEKK